MVYKWKVSNIMTRIAEVSRQQRDVGDATQEATIPVAGAKQLTLVADCPNAVLDDPDTDLEFGIYHEVNGGWMHVASTGYRGGFNPSRIQPSLQVEVQVTTNSRVQLRITIRGQRTTCGCTLDSADVLV
jgi:hypothetical protein